MDFTQRLIKNGVTEVMDFRVEYTAECQPNGTTIRLVAQIKRKATEDTKETYMGYAAVECASGRYQFQLTAPATSVERQTLMTDFEKVVSLLCNG